MIHGPRSDVFWPLRVVTDLRFINLYWPLIPLTRHTGPLTYTSSLILPGDTSGSLLKSRSTSGLCRRDRDGYELTSFSWTLHPCFSLTGSCLGHYESPPCGRTVGRGGWGRYVVGHRSLYSVPETTFEFGGDERFVPLLSLVTLHIQFFFLFLFLFCLFYVFLRVEIWKKVEVATGFKEVPRDSTFKVFHVLFWNVYFSPQCPSPFMTRVWSGLFLFIVSVVLSWLERVPYGRRHSTVRGPDSLSTCVRGPSVVDPQVGVHTGLENYPLPPYPSPTK